MQLKFLEVRDSATFIPVCAVRFEVTNEIQRWYLHTAGLGFIGAYKTYIFKLVSGEGHFCPYEWSHARTMPTAHVYIEKHWDELKDGDVVDVQFILGETASPKASQRPQSVEIEVKV